MFELMIHLDGDSEKPLYGQIYGYIRSQIVGGKISCGEKLPSTRFLSRHLQVSRSTVELAYDQLLSEGYIESVPCRGYYAGDVTGLYLGGPPKREDACREEKKATAEAQGVICFSADENDYAHFPYAVWRKLTSGRGPGSFWRRNSQSCCAPGTRRGNGILGRPSALTSTMRGA